MTDEEKWQHIVAVQERMETKIDNMQAELTKMDKSGALIDQEFDMRLSQIKLQQQEIELKIKDHDMRLRHLEEVQKEHKNEMAPISKLKAGIWQIIIIALSTGVLTTVIQMIEKYGLKQ